MSYLPRPNASRTGQDISEIYALAAEELQHADSPEARRRHFRQALLRAFEAGVDAQREIIQHYPHERPTPVPPPPDAVQEEEEPDPGLIPRGVFEKPTR